MLERYQELARNYHQLLKAPQSEEREDARVVLVTEMDRVWGRMSRQQQDLAKHYQFVLYQRLIGGE